MYFLHYFRRLQYKSFGNKKPGGAFIEEGPLLEEIRYLNQNLFKGPYLRHCYVKSIDLH